MKRLFCILSVILVITGLSSRSSAEVRGQVNRRTLNYFLPIDMMSLPCYFSVEIRGAYNSYSGESSIFGPKWTFNHNIRIVPDQVRFKITEGDGFENFYTREKNLEEAKKALVDQLIVAQKKNDSKAGGLKAASVYDELKRRLEADQAFREEQQAKLLPATKPLGAGIYYSFSRGPSTLEMKADGSFTRTFQNKSVEFFNRDGQIIRSADKYGNSISYTYAGKDLTRINDGCGGSVSFIYKTDKSMEGLIDSIRDSLGRELKFEFFANRRLKSFKNLQKELIDFSYDKLGNMLSLSTTKEGKKDEIKVQYNLKYEVEKMIEGSGRETKYSRSFVANNQNHSITEITESKAGKTTSREVVESKVREFETTTKFDGKGAQVSKEMKKLSPTTGYPISILDEKGRGELIDYDADSGNPMRREIVPSGDVMTYQYNKACNQVSSVKSANASASTTEASFTYDSLCNLLKAVETKKGKPSVKIALQWNPKGKIAFMTDEIMGKQLAFTYWKFGKTESITLKDVGTLLVKYSNAGDIEKVDTFVHGAGKERFKTLDTVTANGIILQEVKTVLDSIMGYLRPAGINIGL